MQRAEKITVTALIMTAGIVCIVMLLLPFLGVDEKTAFAEAEPLFDVNAEKQEAASFSVEVIRPVSTPATPKKRILIYHTHTWEAYQQTKDKPYEETQKWRTKDSAANIVAVGAALKACLEAMGYDVTHETSAFEPPDLASAYTRSLAMLDRRVKSGETYDLYLDLHRDAFDDPNAIQRTVTIAGQQVARFMVLIGKGTGQTSAGYDVKPEWEKNYAIAEKITDGLNAQADNLARTICLRSGRFNQHIAPCCVLIECGSNHNTLEEVLNGVPYLAEAIHQTLQSAQ